MAALWGKSHWPSPAQVREALEEGGVVFLKFGQVLGLQRDLLSAEYIRELERLHDRLPPKAPAEVLATVTNALGAAPRELFASFSEEPLAAATIAQVHGATLADGRPVVVKVRRPGLQDRIAEDTATLALMLEGRDHGQDSRHRRRPRGHQCAEAWTHIRGLYR